LPAVSSGSKVDIKASVSITLIFYFRCKLLVRHTRL
jgi:hypothetical protein